MIHEKVTVLGCVLPESVDTCAPDEIVQVVGIPEDSDYRIVMRGNGEILHIHVDYLFPINPI